MEVPSWVGEGVPGFAPCGGEECRRPGRWSRRQRRVYQRVHSLLRLLEAEGYVIAWVMLSTAVGGAADALARHHETLKRRIERRWPEYAGFSHFAVATSEGNGVLHLLWYWRPVPGCRQRDFWIPQGWLSDAWKEIHGADYVWITRYRPGRKSRGRVSRYMVSQYVGGQVGIVRLFWSWRAVGFPMVSVWRSFLRACRGVGIRRVVELWGEFLEGVVVETRWGGRWSLDETRADYAALRVLRAQAV